ncbi:uncharacterized protein [Leptinotarsa decemlineata]|uniref:uncharacterized protein n=1 Tax=Leptinotarsa decemlineata TaxID=7539 RepID=UPI003D30BF1F
MDKQEEEKLLRWFDELSDDGNIESDHDAYSDDGEFDGDLDYVPDESHLSESSSEDDNDGVISPVTETGGETQDSSNEENADNNEQENQSSTEKHNDDYGWVDESSDIPNFDFDSSQTGIKIDGIQNLSPIEVFEKLWDKEVMNLILTSTNEYGENSINHNVTKLEIADSVNSNILLKVN